MKIYYDILTMMRDELKKDKFCNTVTEGLISDIDIGKQTIFPLSHIMVNNAKKIKNIYRFSITLFCMDIVDQNKNKATDKFRGNNNAQDVSNTQLAVGARIVEMLERGALRDRNYELSSDPDFEPFTERFENALSGWAVTFTIDVPNAMTIC